jgi:hypothetical protein
MHASTYLREMFIDWVEGIGDTLTPESVHWILGKLWNCTDILPAGNCEDLDIAQGSTYARAVRKCKAELTL